MWFYGMRDIIAFIINKEKKDKKRKLTNWIAMIPDALIDEKELRATFLTQPLTVSISKYWSSVNSLKGMTEVIRSPSDNDNI